MQISKLNFHRTFINEKIRIMIISSSKIFFTCLMDILALPNLKELILEPVEIIEELKNVESFQENKSISILKIIYPKVSKKSIIYDFVENLYESKYLYIYFKQKGIRYDTISLLKNRIMKKLNFLLFSNNKITNYDICELNFLKNSETIEFNNVYSVGFLRSLFLGVKLFRIKSLIFKCCAFYNADKKSIRSDELETIEFHMCTFNYMSLSDIFHNDFKSRIKHLDFRECLISLRDILWLNSLNFLAGMIFMYCRFEDVALISFKRKEFTYLHSLQLNFESLQSDYEIINCLNEEFGDVIMYQ
ncbi:hypothetical protein CWI36_0012p0010 [Hamiltosporidium magnivora]|uniref:Uncharacterized protein n=1 Tax=Hamiltosporidium magnivora TaxID=148818 RepID=A0A4Q9LMW3_9MICR|nr:hypothetical protein CWI36_0012p0010 [Hamiltosporidium magnivora]